MKERISIVLFLMLICAGSVSAQKNGKPDFTGVWVYDEDKSRGFRGVKPDKYSLLYPNEKMTETMKIEHNGSQLTVAVKRMFEFFDDAGKPVRKEEVALPVLTFYTDGRGEINSFVENETRASKTKWSGKEILVSLAPDDSLKLDGKKMKPIPFTFSLSKKGKELKVSHLGEEVKYDTNRLTGTIQRDYSVTTAVFGKRVYIKVE